MKIFLDTADIEEIRTAARWGVLDGVTTNPTLFAKVGGSYDDILKQVCKITPGPVSAECVKDDVEGMLEEGRHYATLAPNIVVKVAMSENGLEAISRFAEEGIKTNCTLIFTANQGLLAAKAGASLISPFVGRLDDINQDGMIVIRELAEIFAIHEIEFGGARGVDPPPVAPDPGGAGRRPYRDRAVQGPPADRPSPADGQGHRPASRRTATTRTRLRPPRPDVRADAFGRSPGTGAGRSVGSRGGARSGSTAGWSRARSVTRPGGVIARPEQHGLSEHPAAHPTASLGRTAAKPRKPAFGGRTMPACSDRLLDGTADRRADRDLAVLRR